MTLFRAYTVITPAVAAYLDLLLGRPLFPHQPRPVAAYLDLLLGRALLPHQPLDDQVSLFELSLQFQDLALCGMTIGITSKAISKRVDRVRNHYR